jgi:hypothetical protein|uniref:Uncharacterized protein n=1 Tax=Eutreptiella gymnastica TaxID=73025 RepID=A0A7S4CT89_9EUGL|mmetsp:Transcript_12559/g.22816  ORF Transcript_12559/g.22816 Transcript_12559/m.22816 type:complete len:512 (+) Transcript_12559:152-1687(+)|eukprot:CAMPEP_0174300990 /NCGR_PEP_ID=MMETSP0809-20121228/58772_1 /TAXON_ID=73025 ORGANISM="Eutreptiella gymnastica-like, Strain CCMP1594" /NCGR_SAMPLE_ID=MMETSP0809 /ASSEMBLY_ACC=CAM_ASM_000658 /LENGTH=511 /DNA_ID=CAMNT_0015406663 /DNA_START=152 /DNA_END=1687 /DNA_ORIENTATION=-
MGKKKDKIPPPGNKKDPYTNFMKKAKWMQVLKSQQLEIPGNSIQKEGAIIVANCLLKNSFVEKLVLTQTHLGDAGITEFAQMLKVNATIRNIHIGVNDITDIGGVMFASAFLVNRTVQHVSAPGNSFGDDTAAAWAFVLKSNFEIKSLDLSWNAIGYRGIEALSQTFQINNGFTVELGQNRIGDDGCKFWCDALKKNGTKEMHSVLNLWQNDIGSAGGDAIAELVDKNDRIDLLNLSWNSCGSCLGKIAAAMAINQGKGAMVPRPDDEIKKDVQALVDDGFKKQEDFKYVRGNETRVIPRQFWQQEAAFPACTIVTLNLSHNRVGDAGCEEMAKLIAANGYLKFLNLSGNNITSEGGIKLCDGLLVSASLETLNLAHNKITCSAANAFAKVISTTTSLGAIYLQRNEMKDEGKGIISGSVPKGSKIRVNYGALDDVLPLTGVYGVPTGTNARAASRKESRGRGASRKYSTLSAVSSGGGDTARGSSRRKSRSRGSRGSMVSVSASDSLGSP